LELFNIQETDLLPVVRQDAFYLQLIDHGGNGLPAAANEAGNILMSKIVGHTETLGRVLTQVLLHQLPKEMEQAGLDILIQEVEQPVLDVPELGAYLLAIPESQIRPVLQQFLKIVDGKSADADIMLVSLGEFPAEIILLQAELPEKLPPLDDLLDLFIAFIVDIADLDGTLLDKVYFIVVIGLEIDVFSLRNVDDMVLDLQLLIFIIGQMAPEIIIL